MSTKIRCSIFIILMFSGGCKNDFGGTRLLEISYAPIEILVPFGWQQTSSFVVSQASFNTNFLQELSDANVSTSEVDLVGGLRAQIISTNGEDFSEVERIDIRTCSINQSNGCTSFDVLFSITDNFLRRRERIDLNPSLRNMKELFLSEERIQLEIVFVFGTTTSREVNAIVNWSIQVVGDL